MQNIFISHDTREKEVAIHLSEFLERNFKDVKAFCSSRPKDLNVGKNWYNTIIKRASQGNICLVMLTPDNVSNPWLHFEAGLLFGTSNNHLILPVLFAGLIPDCIPSTIKFHQALNLTDGNRFDAFLREHLNAGKKLAKKQNFTSYEESQPYIVRRMIEHGYFAKFPTEDALPLIYKPFTLNQETTVFEDIYRKQDFNRQIVAIRATLIPRSINQFNHYKFGFALFAKDQKLFHFHGGCNHGINAWTVYPKPINQVPIHIPAHLEMEKPFKMAIWFKVNESKVICTGTDCRGNRYTIQDDHGNHVWRIVSKNWDIVRISAWADELPFQIDVESFEVDFTISDES